MKISSSTVSGFSAPPTFFEVFRIFRASYDIAASKLNNTNVNRSEMILSHNDKTTHARRSNIELGHSTLEVTGSTLAFHALFIRAHGMGIFTLRCAIAQEVNAQATVPRSGFDEG